MPYRDDPTILAWELMNESTVATTAGVEARRAWVAEMAKVVHALDPHHLVTPGVSVYRTESERRDWLAVCKLPGVDYCDAHIYPEALLENRNTALLEAALDDVVQLANHVAGKPLVLGEFGIHGDADGNWDHQTRGYWMGRVFERLRFDGAAGGIVWLYQPAGGDDRRHGISVGETGAEGPRAAIRAAAAERPLPADAVNPDLGPNVGEVPLMALHGEFIGKAAIVPKLKAGADGAAGDVRVTWDPATYERAAWEATGLYDGGAIAHAWGTETGWFEYTYRSSAPEVATDGAEGKPVRVRATRAREPYALTLRARVSSEFPGATSPPDGASEFEVTLDGISIGTATAARDDGRGAWIEVRTAQARRAARRRRRRQAQAALRRPDRPARPRPVHLRQARRKRRRRRPHGPDRAAGRGLKTAPGASCASIAATVASPEFMTSRFRNLGLALLVLGAACSGGAKAPAGATGAAGSSAGTAGTSAGAAGTSAAGASGASGAAGASGASGGVHDRRRRDRWWRRDRGRRCDRWRRRNHGDRGCRRGAPTDAGGDAGALVGIKGHPNPAATYPTYDGFSLYLVEEFNAAIDLDKDPLWTWGDGTIDDGLARFGEDAISFADGKMKIAITKGDTPPGLSVSSRHAAGRDGAREDAQERRVPLEVQPVPLRALRGVDAGAHGREQLRALDVLVPHAALQEWREIDFELVADLRRACRRTSSSA